MVLCSISGSECSNPCVSPQGHTFEKRVLLSLLTTNGGQCPVTKAPLSEDDLIDIVPHPQNVVPSAPSSISGAGFGGLLATMQTEWDALMVETYTLKTSLTETRRELTQALYQNDAAVRVIARLTMERDQARAMLAQGGAAAPTPSSGDAMDVEGSKSSPVPSSVVSAMTSTWTSLCEARKARKGKVVEGQVTGDDIAKFNKKSSKPIHKSSGKTGITVVASCPGDDDLLLTGGVDKQAIVFNKATGKIVATKAAGSKSVSSVSWKDPETFAVGSLDGTVKVFGGADYEEVANTNVGSTCVAVDVHPSGSYVLALSYDSLSVLDISSGEALATLKEEGAGYTCGGLHPDGLIYAGGNQEGEIHVWDIKSGGKASTLKAEGKVCSIAFSENGYHFAAGLEGGKVQVFDMRKQKLIGTAGGEEFGAIGSLGWEGSGKYLAFAGAGKVGVVETKKWSEVVVELKEHKKDVTGVAWGKGGQWLASVGLDRQVKVYRV